MTTDNSLVEEISEIVRARQASLASRIAFYCETTWYREGGEAPKQPIAEDQMTDLVALVFECFDGIGGQLQGVVEIDAFSRELGGAA